MPYPDEYDSFRTMTNVPGLDYNAADTSTLFAEDMAAVHSSIQQTQQFIGLADSIKTSPLYLAIMNIIYPVGKIVHFAEGINLAEHFGFGTWLMHEGGKFTVALDGSDSDFNTYGGTGGSKTHDHGLSGGFADVSFEGSYIHARRVNSTTANLNHRQTVSGAVFADKNTAIRTGLSGSTNDTEALPPYVVIARYVRTA